MAAAFTLHLVTIDSGTGASTDHGALDVEFDDDIDEAILNGTASVGFSALATDPLLASVNPKPWATEILVYRAATAIFAGPITTVESDGKRVQFRADDISGHFDYRFIDRATGRTDYMAGAGDFESGLTGWTTNGTVTATADTAQHNLGTQSAKLVSSSANLNNYISKTFSITGTGVGSLITAPVWFRYASSGFLGPSIASFGMWIRQKDPITHAVINPDPDDLVQIDGSRNPDEWIRDKAITRVPPLATVDVEVLLYSLGGTIWFDAIRAVLMESTPFDNVDQTTMAWGLVNFCQDSTAGWSNLGITNGSVSTGVLRGRAYQHADHTRLADALAELVEMDDGFDWWITPSRVFTTAYPRRGTDRSGTVTLTVKNDASDTGNCLLKRWSVDGHQAASSVVVLGTGSGPDREEGNANTTSGTIVGGTTIRKVITPPRADAPIDTLTATANRELSVSDDPTIWELEITDATIAALVGVGDKVTIDLPSAAVGSYLARTAVARIVRKGWRPKPDTAVVTLNVAV